MTNRQKMRKKLDEKVIPFLEEHGLSGKYPDYSRSFPDRLELLTFQTNKWGGSFRIEISTVFLNVTQSESNLSNRVFEMMPDIKDIKVSWTNIRYDLKGNHDGWFYYDDLTESTIRFISFLYKLWLTLIKSNHLKTYQPKVKIKTIVKIDENSFDEIAIEIIKQMDDAFVWWEKHSTPRLMKDMSN